MPLPAIDPFMVAACLIVFAIVGTILLFPWLKCRRAMHSLQEASARHLSALARARLHERARYCHKVDRAPQQLQPRTA